MQDGAIGQILGDLDQIVQVSLREKDRIGYFAAFYQRLVSEVGVGIERGYFVDAERTAALQEAFSCRYLNALKSFRQDDGPARCWRSAFEAAGSRRFLVLQHVLLALNAHVNLDLGIAINRVAPTPARLKELEEDFRRLRRILEELVAQVQRRIVEISPWIGLLDRLGQRRKGRFIQFSMRAAGRAAWKVAKDLSTLTSQQQRELLRSLDGVVLASQRRLEGRKPHVRCALWLIRRRENRDVQANIRYLLKGFGSAPGEVVQSLLSRTGSG